MPESKNPNSINSQENFTQKSLPIGKIVARVLATAGILSTMGLSKDSAAKTPEVNDYTNPVIVAELSLQDLETRVEAIYAIQVLSPRERSEMNWNKGKVKPVEWTRNQLLSLAVSLDTLPPHFYSPGPKNVQVGVRDVAFGGGSEEEIKKWQEEHAIANIQEYFGKDFYVSREDLEKALEQGYFEKRIERALPVSFAIVDEFPSDDGNVYYGQCNCGIPNEKQEIILAKSAFEESQIDNIGLYYYPIIVHELTHRISRPGDYPFIRDSLVGVSDDITFTKFLKENSTKVQNSLFEAAMNVKDMKGMDESYLIANRFRYGAKSPNEFISVASEFYIQGKAVFLRDYGLLVGKEKAQKLYDYMKDKIFKGREYFQFH